MTRTLPAQPDFDQYRKQAKELLRAHGAAERSAIARIRAYHPKLHRSAPEAIREARFVLADAQLVLARELGFPSWPRFKAHVAALAAGEVRAVTSGFYWYADRAGRIVQQLRAGGAAVLESARLWHPDLAAASDDALRARTFDIDDGRIMVAREHGFDTWTAFVAHLEAVGEGPHELARADPELASEAEEHFADAVRAIQQDNADGLRAVLEARPALTREVSAGGQTLLLLAAAERSEALVALLLLAGADPNQTDESGWTPLHQAAYGEPPEPDANGQRQSLAVMEALLAAGARLDAESRGSGGTPLLQALFWGHRPLAERLAQEDIVPLNLRSAAGLGRIELIESLVDGDGSLRPEAGALRGYAAPHAGFPAPTPTDATEEVLADALVYAAANGRLAAVDALLDRGADPNAAPYQSTPLLAAVGKGHGDVAQRLLERGAAVDARADWAGIRGLTALHHAVSVSRLDMVKLLVEAGADLTARDATHASTPASWAGFFENTDIARFLEDRA